MTEKTLYNIRIDNLESPEVINLLREHLALMERTSPQESRHALDLDALRKPDVTFWTLWEGSQLAGFGALKRLSGEHAEIKSMRTAASHLRKGIASRILKHIIQEAKARGHKRLSLETGSMEYFAPARKFYSSFGFNPCPPFGSYVEDPNSIFMTKNLDDEGT